MARRRIYGEVRCVRCDKRLHEPERLCFCSAPDAPRAQLRDKVRLTGDKLASAARVYLTLSTEYAKRETFRRQMAKPPSCVYPAWARPTVQHTKRPDTCFPEDLREWTIARYVADFERLNGLRSTTRKDEEKAA